MNLDPCPRCGANPSDNEINESRLGPPRMDGTPAALISVTIRHICASVTRSPGMAGPTTVVQGRDHHDCEWLWNTTAGAKSWAYETGYEDHAFEVAIGVDDAKDWVD